MKAFKKLFTLTLAAAAAVTCLTTTAFAEEAPEPAPNTASASVQPRASTKLPAGTYYCLSTGRTDSYIEIVGNTSTDRPTAKFNNVYAGSDYKKYVTGTGEYAYTGLPEVTFTLKTWHFVGESGNQATDLMIKSMYVNGEFIWVNGEVYARR